MCLVLMLLNTILLLPSPPDTAPQQLTFTDRDVSEGCFGQLSWFPVKQGEQLFVQWMNI